MSHGTIGTVAVVHLTEETWGERLARARRRAGLKYREVAAALARVWPVSYTTIMRLESLAEPPPDSRRRAVAFLVVSAYGFDPSDFGLASSDLPPGIDPERVRDLLKRKMACSRTEFPAEAA